MERAATAASFALVGWYGILWGISLLGWQEARRRYRLRPRSPLSSHNAANVPGVSILRPLKGLDHNLFENLESTFTQEYPKFEILLSVADASDQAIPVARDIIAKYPNIPARLIVGEDAVGVNPKVNNLMRSYREAAHDIIWVLDSNISVLPGTLGRAVDSLEGVGAKPGAKRVSLVHHVPVATATGTALGSRIEEAFINTNHARMYVAINTLAIDSCVNGKSNIYRRSDLEQVIGGSNTLPAPGDTQPRGLAAFGKYLAEDNMIGLALWHQLGTRHELSCDVAYNSIGNMTLSMYCWRRIRWIRVRKQMVMAATLLEPMTESFVIGSLVAASLYRLLNIPPWIFLPIHIGAWLAVDLDVYATLAEKPLARNQQLPFVFAWFLRELLALPIWAYAVMGNQMDWRGRKYVIIKNGEVRPASAVGSPLSFTWWKNKRDHYQPLDVEG